MKVLFADGGGKTASLSIASVFFLDSGREMAYQKFICFLTFSPACWGKRSVILIPEGQAGMNPPSPFLGFGGPENLPLRPCPIGISIKEKTL
jgi:hypothetical protein